MWCVLKEYDGEISCSPIFHDFSKALSHAEHVRALLNFHWRVRLVSVSFPSSVEIVNKVINGKRAALQGRKAR